MPAELFPLLKDLLEIPRQLMQRKRLDEGEGVDYSSDKWRKQVRETVERLHPEKMQLKLVEAVDETPSTKTFRFTRVDGPLPPFRAGQYVNLFLSVNGVATSRPYSISSPPQHDTLDLTVRVKPDGFVSGYLLDHAQVGQTFESSGPAGRFYIEPLIERGEWVFIAGGSGITPFMSMLRDQANKGWPRKIHLIYGSRNLEETIFRSAIDRLARKNPQFNYALVLSEPEENYRGVRGFITEHIIGKHVGPLKGKTLFICGPNALYDFVLPELQKLDVEEHRIRREAYGPPADITQTPGWPAQVKADSRFTLQIEGGGSMDVLAGEPLINALERQGRQIPALCRSGECSYCRSKLLSGRVFMPPQTGVRESDRLNGYIHPCVSYPISDLSIRLPS